MNNNHSLGKVYYIASGIGFLSFLLLLKNCFVVINPGERGVVMNFGKVQNTILDEGIHWKTPISTSVKSLSVRVQKTDIEVEAGTKDLQIINAALTLNWHIEPNKANLVYQRIGDEEQIIETIIKPAMTEVLKATTPQKTAEEILIKRAELKQEIDRQIKTRLASYGLYIDDASLVNVSFSPEFAKSIEAKQIAQQEAKKAEYEAIKASKQAEAEVNRAKGQAEAQRLLKETITPELLQRQAIEKWDGQFPTVISGDGGALPFINITPTVEK
jgi:regulator of protease activity HflC (stomatin/prohibitin superfamily)